MKRFSNALPVVWTVFYVDAQANRMIVSAILAVNGNIVCGHETINPALARKFTIHPELSCGRKLKMPLGQESIARRRKRPRHWPAGRQIDQRTRSKMGLPLPNLDQHFSMHCAVMIDGTLERLGQCLGAEVSNASRQFCPQIFRTRKAGQIIDFTLGPKYPATIRNP
jgi:hypothetical protein